MKANRQIPDESVKMIFDKLKELESSTDSMVTNDTDRFNPEEKYYIGDYCTYNNTLYTFTESNLGEDFSTERSYTVGEYCKYEDFTYVFTKDKAAGAWDESVVETTNIAKEPGEWDESIVSVSSLVNELRRLFSINESLKAQLPRNTDMEVISELANQWTITASSGTNNFIQNGARLFINGGYSGGTGSITVKSPTFDLTPFTKVEYIYNTWRDYVNYKSETKAVGGNVSVQLVATSGSVTLDVMSRYNSTGEGTYHGDGSGSKDITSLKGKGYFIITANNTTIRGIAAGITTEFKKLALLIE